MTSLADAITLLETVFINTSFFETFMIPQMIVIVATLLLITRETSDWKKLAFPVMIGWNAFGMYVSTVFLAGAGMLMVIDGLSTEVVSSGLKSISGYFSEIKDYGSRAGKKRWKKKVEVSKRRDKKWKEIIDLMASEDKVGDLTREQLSKFTKELSIRGQERESKEAVKRWTNVLVSKDRERRRKLDEEMELFRQKKKFEEERKKSSIKESEY